jgi:hypothetical protein
MCRCWPYTAKMSADDFRLLAQALNARQAGTAEFVSWPKADHGLYTHATEQKAFGRDPDQKYDPQLSRYVLDWLAKY